MWARRTDGSGGSFWLTPTVEDAGREGSPEWAARWASGEKIPFTQQRLRTQALAAWPTPDASMGTGGRTGTRGAGLTGMRPDGTKVQVTINAAVAMEPMDWPTPRASPSENRQTKLTPSQLAGTHGLSLAASVNHWQTPVASHRLGGNRSAYEGAPFRPALSREVKEWATPKASDADRGDCPSERARNSPSLVSQAPEASARGPLESARPTPTSRDWKSGSASAETLERNARPLSEVMRTQQPGPLNPAWVEALMGFPQGWTEPPDVPPTKRSRLTKTLEEIFATPSPIDGPPVAANLSTPGKPRARRTRSPHAPRG